MKINVPRFQQEKSNTCGVAALRMALGYLGDEVSEKELLKGIKVHSFGSFTTDLGLIALKRGYKVTILAFHLPLLGSLNISFGKEITLSELKRITVKPKDKMTFDSWKDYLKAGGKMYWDTPRISQLEKWINNKIPVLININTAALRNYWKNWDNGHYLVVDGVTNDDISVLDPDMTRDKASYTIQKEILLPSWSINSRNSSGHLMVIEK